MVRKIQDGLFQIRSIWVSCYLLVESKNAYIIDGGFFGDVAQIEAALQTLGLQWTDLKAILLTHGHIDHTHNIHAIQQKSQAMIYGHPKDNLHFKGQYPYQGINKITGFLEAAVRTLFGFRPFEIDKEIKEGDVLELWGGLQVIHLPGHTQGHCGYYSLKHKILFTGDLFGNWAVRVMLPWPWYNSCPEKYPASIKKVIDLNPPYVCANHCDRASPAIQKDRFMKRFGRYDDGIRIVCTNKNKEAKP